MTETVTLTTSPVRARTIMGKNFFGIEEVLQHFGSKPMVPIKLMLATLASIPFSPYVLEQTRETHILVLRPPLSLVDLRNMFPDFFWRNVNGQVPIDSYIDYGFAKNRGSIGWHLVRKTPVEPSGGESVDQARRLVHGYEQVPPARVMMYMLFAYHLATREYLLFGDKNVVRTANIIQSYGDICRYHLCMGNFDEKGLYADGYGADGHADGIGFASEMKPMV